MVVAGGPKVVAAVEVVVSWGDADRGSCAKKGADGRVCGNGRKKHGEGRAGAAGRGLLMITHVAAKARTLFCTCVAPLSPTEKG